MTMSPVSRIICALWTSVLTMMGASIIVYHIRFSSLDTALLIIAIGISSLSIGLSIGEINAAIIRKRKENRIIRQLTKEEADDQELTPENRAENAICSTICGIDDDGWLMYYDMDKPPPRKQERMPYGVISDIIRRAINNNN